MKQKRRAGRVLTLAMLDIMLAGVILLTFAFFHHVLPAIKTQIAVTQPSALPEQMQSLPVEPPVEDVPSAVITEQEVTETPEEPDATEVPPEEEPVVEVDNRTEWQKKFEEHFSDEIIVTENSYKSPNVSIEITTVQDDYGYGQMTYHVADIYVGSMNNFVTYTANNQMVFFDSQDAMEMHQDSGAILSMTGDFMTYQQTGLLIRNGEIYADDYASCDICVLYPDGTMETYLEGTYDKDEIMARNPLQVWNFGPVLLDADGLAVTRFNTSQTVMQRNPRSALGYYEPGHYCFVVVDGRQKGYSIGMFLNELSNLFESLGCKAAYNLDGGGSALMMFGDSRYSQMSNGGDRDLGDILVIRETEAAE